MNEPQAWVVLQPYTDRTNVYPIGQPRPDGAFDIVAEVTTQGMDKSAPPLVAAAPALLAALEDVLAAYKSGLRYAYFDEAPSVVRARAAIAQAKGGQP